MADPATKSIANPIAEIMSAITGGSLPMSEVQDARYMLALLQPQGDLPDDTYRAGAQELYQKWFEQARENLPSADLSAEDMAATVRIQMADDMIKEMTLLNGGQELSDDAQKQIRELLLDKDAEGFADAMMDNRAQVLVHLKQQKLAMQQDPTKRPVEFAGIMALLAGSDPALGGVAVNNVEVSPLEIAKGNEYSVFKNVFRLNGLGNGAESTLAMIEGVPRKDWGEYNDKTGGYANLSPYATPSIPAEQKEFWNGTEGHRIAEMLEKREVVSFADEDAQDAWVKEMADALTGDDPVRNARELTERMREFAGESPSITMESEIVHDQDRASTAAADYTKFLEREGFISFGSEDDSNAWHVELERIQNDGIDVMNTTDLMEHAQDFIDSYNQENPNGIKVEHKKIAEAQAAYDAVVEQRAASAAEVSEPVVEGVPDESAELDRVADPVCAGGVDAYLLGESGVACIAVADREETPRIRAVAEVRNEMRAVPNVDPALVAPEIESSPMVGPR